MCATEQQVLESILLSSCMVIAVRLLNHTPYATHHHHTNDIKMNAGNIRVNLIYLYRR